MSNTTQTDSNTQNTINSLNSLNNQNSDCLHISCLPFETMEDDILLLFKEYRVKSVKVFK
jgi:RNA recognition motif-containing protein